MSLAQMLDPAEATTVWLLCQVESNSCTSTSMRELGERDLWVEWEAMHSRQPAEPHVLVGDLNALRMDDYTQAEWAALERLCPCTRNNLMCMIVERTDSHGAAHPTH
eukprot:6471181-Amphidinium_carterae.2